MSECEKYQEELSALMDGELAVEREAAVKAHLDGCQACRDALAAWEKLNRAAGDVALPNDSSWERVWSKVERAAAQRRAEIRLRREIRRGVVVAAIAATVLVAAYILPPREVPTRRVAEFEVVSIETSKDYTPVVMMPQGKDMPVIWLERI